ncbi:MAG: tRNA pseudouridine(38-40) synthase TruA [Sediminicola sp.]|tara:strand:+ start:31550 stop:32338 length:789 start_codon:yes stop_codon:yes gene_type:complete
MQDRRNFYLIEVQFLGFRYSGWQKQPGRKTIEGMLLKTLKFILPGQRCKILGAGRTDAKVSALDAAFELFLDGDPPTDLPMFTDLFNKNLPPDIRVVGMTEVDGSFNIIGNGKEKEYVYLFSFGQKSHPFCAPFLANFVEALDLERMIMAAKLFEGTHNFENYTVRHQEHTNFERTVLQCYLCENEVLSANFFPPQSYALHIVASGFMRYQVRMIMGALVLVGRGALSPKEIENSLKKGNNVPISYVAPGSGLLLNRLDFDR